MTLLTASGVATTLHAAAQVFLPARQGSLQTEIRGFACV
jgi:hypothetical protein